MARRARATWSGTTKRSRINNSGEDFSLPPQRVPATTAASRSAPNYEAAHGHVPGESRGRRIDDPVAQVVDAVGIREHQPRHARQGRQHRLLRERSSNLTQQGAVKFLEGLRAQLGRVNVDQQFGDRLSGEHARRTTAQSTEDGAHLDETAATAVVHAHAHPVDVDLLNRDDLGRLYIRPNPLAQGEQNFNPLYAVENNRRS